MHHDESQGNKKSTGTSDIAPGAPIWYRSSTGVHNNKDSGHGYGAQDPVPLTSGTYKKGGALTRFGKFGWRKDDTKQYWEHGAKYRIKLIREEGSQGEWTLRIKQSRNDTGVLGVINSGVEHGYSICRSDVDLITLNKNLPGFRWDEETQSALVTFKDGEREKWIQALAPYRTTVKTLKPDVLRQPFTYHVPEYIPYNFGANRIEGSYQGMRPSGRQRIRQIPYCSWYRNNNCGGPRNHDYNQPAWYGADYNNYSIRHGKQTTGDRWTYYHVYTLPMPRTWIEKLRGNEVYLDNYDRNYPYRQLNNTCRPKHMANRFDDTTEPDAETDGWVTRYDHNNKMEAVVGRSRFVSMYMQQGNRHVTYSGSYTCYCRCCSRKVTAYKLATKPFVADQEYHFISNDRRITHRYKPEYYGATLVGILYRPILNEAGQEMYIPSLKSETANPIYGNNYCWPGWRPGHHGASKTLPSLGTYIPISGAMADHIVDSEWKMFKDYPNKGKDFWKSYRNLSSQYNTWFTLSDDNGCIHKEKGLCNNTCHNWGTTPYFSTQHPLNAELKYKSFPRMLWQMQTGWGLSQTSNHWGWRFSEPDVIKNYNNGLKQFDLAPNINPKDREDLKYIHIPLNHTGWKREDYPGDPWFKLFKENLGTMYPRDRTKFIDDGTYRGVEYYAFVAYSRNTTTGYDFVKGTHPLTPGNFHHWNTQIEWKTGIPAKWQTFYESTRYKPGIDDPDQLHWSQERSDAEESGLAKQKIQGLTSQPTDKIFSYGDPKSGVGDLAQVMFNHKGCTSDDFITGQTIGTGLKLSKGSKNGHPEVTASTAKRSKTEWFVVKDEDPSALKEYYDGTGKSWQRWPASRWHGVRHDSTCHTYYCHHRRHTYTNVNRWAEGVTHRGFTAPEDWTDHWLVHEPLCAGKLDQLDIKNSDNNFDGLLWDKTTYDTSNGIESREVGYGSPGFGEQGTSRFLYDFRDLVHPLSSYQLNEQNLEGYYLCCTDHIDREVNLIISKFDEDDPYDLGETDCNVALDHTSVYDPDRHESYDPNIKGDSRIMPGPTFKTNDDWDKPPTNKSVTERLFTVDGAIPADPVVFLGLSAGVFPGGDPENPFDELPPAPGILRIDPLASRLSFTIDDTKNRDWENDPLIVVKSFRNTGAGDLILTLPYSLGEDDPYTYGDGTTTGDDASLWSWEYTDIKKPTEEYAWPAKPDGLRHGPDGLYNTVSLSANEICSIKYMLGGQSKAWREYNVGADGVQPDCIADYKTSQGYTYTDTEFPVFEDDEFGVAPGDLDDPDAEEPAAEPTGTVTHPVLDIPSDPALVKTVKVAEDIDSDGNVTTRVSHILCKSRYNRCNHDIVVQNTDGSERLRTQSFVVKYLKF